MDDFHTTGAVEKRSGDLQGDPARSGSWDSRMIGQENIKERLKSSIINGNVNHAYIFEGEEGSGKKTLADLFSMTLQCERVLSDSSLPDDPAADHSRRGGGRTAEPCLCCPSCSKALSRNHPDIIRLTHEKPNSISVNEIREQVVNDILIKPYSGRYKIYIIAEAEKMTIQAQNALLKTLEEPPEYAVIILLTENAAGLLPTIISRCAVLRLYPLDDNVINKYLLETLNVDEYQADIYTALARGNIGRAKSFLGNEAFNTIKDEALRLLKNIQDMGMGRFTDTMKLLGENKAGIDDFFDILTLWFRDVLLCKATGSTERLIFKEELASIKNEAGSVSFEGLNKTLKAIDEARKRLSANVNYEMTLELLILNIKSSLR